MPKEYANIKDVLQEGEKEGLFKIGEKKIEYLPIKKSYNITDPEEQVRASFYYELIKKYQYSKERIDLEVSVKGEKRPAADIVVYEDDERKKPYIVVECKKDGISQAEIKQAIEEGIPNAHYLKSKYAIIVAGNVRIAFDIANFPPQEREKNVLADIPIRYGKVIKFKYRKGDPEWDLKEVTRDELLAKFQQCHDTLWEGGKRNPAEAFDEMSKLMFCKIHDERFLTKKGEPYQFQIGTHETIKEVAERIRDVYEDAKKRDINVFLEPMKVEDPIIYSVAEVLQGISLWRTELDTKGEAYEQFLGGVFKGTMGQYFTPRPIVKFMVDFLEPTDKDLVIDPACGSGGFLIYTLEKVRRDLEEGLDSKDAEYRWREFALKQVFGIEVNSQLARISMMNMIIHEDGHTNIENNDALTYEDRFDPRRNIKLSRFTLLLTNPPFGAKVKDREKLYLTDYELGGKTRKRNQQNTEILFIERCLDFLKPNGRMGIVLPDGILTNSSLQYVRDFITENAQILGVVSLPQTAFKRPASKGSGDTGSGVKASLLFLRKKKEGERLSENYSIFMAVAEHIGYDATGRPDKDEFPGIIEAWRRFRMENRIDFFVKAPLCFSIGRGEAEGRIDPFYYKPEFSTLVQRLKSRYKLIKFGEIISEMSGGATPKAKGKAYLENGGIPFLRVQNITEEGIKLEDVKYINEETHNKYLRRSKLKSKDLIFTITGRIGTVAVVPEDFGEGNINQHSVRIHLIEGIKEKYISSLFNTTLGRSLSLRGVSGGTRIALDYEAIKSIHIPLPPPEIQDKIASMMDEAYKAKNEKETEAENLLNSIEPYVLDELGIKILEIEEKTPKIFNITADMIKGSRLDPFYYEPKYMLIEKALDRCEYPLQTIGNILSGPIVNGLDARKFIETGIKYLRVGNIKPDEIDETDIKFLDIPLENVKKDIRLESNDVLLTRKGTFGISAVVGNTTNYIISSEIMRLRLRDGVNPFYFSIINNASVVREQYKQKAVGAIMGSLSQEVLKTVKIPFPPLPIQQKIANEVRQRREKAKRLKEEAKNLFEKAKIEVEKIIVG